MDFNLKELAKRINTLDTYYEMSDSTTKFNSCVKEEEKISHWLHGLSDAEMVIVIKNLTKKGMFNYNRYFKNK